MKLLLISPRYPENFWTFSWTFDHVIQERKFTNPPLGLATLAALCPAHWEVEIVDENVRPIDWSASADIVGVGGMSAQYSRHVEILQEFRRRGHFTVAGGSFPSLCPERFADHADTVVSGEAEYIWPEFCTDFEAGRQKPLYEETGTVDITESPTPRFDLIDWRFYLAGSVQFSRGCPFQCEFCDIIVMFGRKPRTKRLAQVEAELEALRREDVQNIVFVDDNLIGRKDEARKLLDFLGGYQEGHRYPFAFGTEASLNLAQYPDLLEGFRRARFAWVFVGIESPSEDALKETKKVQNTGRDMVESVRTIYSYGVDVFGGFIVGFDADDSTIFDRQFDFIVESGIILSMVGMLMAPPRTPLYERLEKEGRLVPETGAEATLINAGAATNIVPLQMTREELSAGCHALHHRLLDDAVIYRRIANKLPFLDRPRSYGFRPREWSAILAGLMVHGVLPGGPRRWAYFARSLFLGLRRPWQIHHTLRAVLSSWSYAYGLRAFAEAYLRPDSLETEKAAAWLRHRLERGSHFPAGILVKACTESGQPHLRLELGPGLQSATLRNLRRQLRVFLRRWSERLVVDCCGLRALEPGLENEIRRLVADLRDHRYEVQVELSESLYREIHRDLEPLAYSLG